MTKTYKYGLILTLLFRSFTLASDISKFRNEVNELKTTRYKKVILRILLIHVLKVYLTRYL